MGGGDAAMPKLRAAVVARQLSRARNALRIRHECISSPLPPSTVPQFPPTPAYPHMSYDTTKRTPPDAGFAPAFLPCSDCRAPMRNHYFALDQRPVCPKCRAGYERQIRYGTGAGSLGRMLLWGGGTALAGALVLGIVGNWVGFLRVLCALAVAYPVAKVLNKATGDFYTRRKQVIAVVLVWSAISLASLVPIVIQASRLSAEAARPATPAEAALAIEDSLAESDLEDLERTLSEDAAPRPVVSLEERKAAELRSGGFLKGLAVAFVLFLILPIVSAFGVAGPQAAAVALLGLGFALYKVWDWTSDGVSYRISGPHRVGSGPIATTW